MAETQKLLTVRLEDSLLKRFRAAAESHQTTMATVVRDALLAWLEKNPASKGAGKKAAPKKAAAKKAAPKKAAAKKPAAKKAAPKKAAAKKPAAKKAAKKKK